MLKLEIFLEIKSSEDGEGERKANSHQRSCCLPQCFLVDIELVDFVYDVSLLAHLVLVREGAVGDLGVQEVAEPVPALAHPVHQELGGRHHSLHCCIVPGILILPDTLQKYN